MKKYIFTITLGNYSAYSKFIIFLIFACLISIFSWGISFFLPFQITEGIETVFRLTFVLTAVFIYFSIKFKPPMDFIKGVEINKKGVELITEKKSIAWEDIENIKIQYKSYKNETKRSFSYIISQNGYNNTIILNLKDRKLEYSFYIKSVEEANALFDCVSFLREKNKPILIQHIGRS